MDIVKPLLSRGWVSMSAWLASTLLAGIIAPLEVRAASFIVDNPNAVVSPNISAWSSSHQSTTRYGSDYLHDKDIDKGPSKYVTYFTPNLNAGEYDVYACWNHSSNRASNVPIEVRYSAQTITTVVNQEKNQLLDDGCWNYIGRYQFNSGSDGYVRIHTYGTNGYVIADAVKFKEVTQVIVDNKDGSKVTVNSAWTSSTSSAHYGEDYFHDSSGTLGGRTIRYNPALPEAGQYDVYLYWNTSANRASNVPITIHHNNEDPDTNLVINQKQGVNGGWNFIGRYNFSDGNSPYLRISNDNGNADGYVIADAVRFVKAAEPIASGPDYTHSGALVFRSGFEPESSGNSPDCITDISGIDASVASPHDWVEDLEDNSKFGFFEIQYGAGAGMCAKLVANPSDSNKKVLEFSVGSNSSDVVRVQANLHDNKDEDDENGLALNEIYYSFRVYLNPNLENLKLMIPDALEHFTLAEFWNQPAYLGGAYPYRVSLNLMKPAGKGNEQQLYFSIKGEPVPQGGPFVPTWSQHNYDYSVPTGQWLKGEIYYRKGKENAGRFYFAITPEGGTRQVIFDIYNSTIDPNPDNTSPPGLRNFEPLKLYAAGATPNITGPLQVLWDDLWFYESIACSGCPLP